LAKVIRSIFTPANVTDLVDINEKLDKVLPLNKFNDEPNWSEDAISADQIYRIQKFVGRVVEETGVILQGQIIDMFHNTNKVFPYKIQLIKIDRNLFNTDIIVEDQICQTITPLKNECRTYVLTNNSGDQEISELVIGNYAIATYWTEYRDMKYKNWFIGKYMVRYV
jgi:hypothetical protein